MTTDDETLSEAVDRLLRGVSLLDLVDGGRDPERATVRKGVLDRTAQADVNTTGER
ncbi:hypothetical protein [Halorubrum sp. CSM-61]|uniref:hypothetical protein n=1 Tax=Halorubrum sp. CSM-61 TaxID=2485838 RepID=UPI0013DDC6BD|nr:hypothetical protein [Halorubrum sp. CSM-61]